MLILEVTISDLNSSDKQKVLLMHLQMKELQSKAIEAYEVGNYDLAADLDEQYENLAEELESILIDLDDFEHDGAEGESLRDVSMQELESELISSYAEFIKGNSYHIRTKEELIDRLRAIIRDYSFYFGNQAKITISDEELINLSKELYDEKLSFKKSRGFKNESFYLKEITLYHGTIIDNKDSIEKHGLVPSIGEFTSDAYGMDPDSYEEYGFEDLIFAADKKDLQNAITAMIGHISKKLNKSFQQVTREDIRNNGLLVILKDIEEIEDQYYAQQSWVQRHREDDQNNGSHPAQVEPGDYYTNADSVGHDILLYGNKLINFMIKNNLIDTSNLMNRIKKRNPEASKEQIIKYINNLTPEQRRKLKTSY